jgi:YesN/AraC family two-component response regulator
LPAEIQVVGESMVRAGFRMLLDGESGLEVVAEASNGREAVDEAARFHTHAVRMDIRMPTSTVARRHAASSRPIREHEC